MPKYRYTGDVPTVFITLQKDGHTWVPSKGDEIDSQEEIGHPLLELIVGKDSAPPVSDIKTEVPAEPENTESPDTADESKEN